MREYNTSLLFRERLYVLSEPIEVRVTVHGS